MPRSQRPPFRFTPYDLPPEALKAMPRDVQPAWKKYRQAVDQHTLAEADATAAATALRDAPRFDTAAAEQAVAKGKPIPAPTQPTAQQVYELARRNADALAAHADRLEHAWLETAEAHRPDWAAAVNARLDALIGEATGLLEALEQPLTDLAAVEAVRLWLRPYPAHRRLGDHTVGGAHPIGESLREVVAQVNGLRPQRVDAELAADLAEHNRRADALARYGQVAPTGVDPQEVA